MTKVLISGGSGLVGIHLCKILKAKGYQVSILSRQRKLNAEIQTFAWNTAKNEIDLKSRFKHYPGLRF